MRRPRERRALAAAGCCAIALAACGGDGEGANAERFEGEEKAVAAVVDQLTDASRDSNGDRICNDLFAAKLEASVARASKRTCGDELSDNVGSAKADFRVEEVTVEGELAEAAVVDERKRRSQLTFQRVEDEWRITSIGELR